MYDDTPQDQNPPQIYDDVPQDEDVYEETETTRTVKKVPRKSSTPKSSMDSKLDVVKKQVDRGVRKAEREGTLPKAESRMSYVDPKILAESIAAMSKVSISDDDEPVEKPKPKSTLKKSSKKKSSSVEVSGSDEEVIKVKRKPTTKATKSRSSVSKADLDDIKKAQLAMMMFLQSSMQPDKPKKKKSTKKKSSDLNEMLFPTVSSKSLKAEALKDIYG